MKVKTLAMTAVTLTCAAVTAFGQEGTINSKAELRKALATAVTAADHARIAFYYHRSADKYSRMQAEEEQIAARWQKQYENWTKSPNPYVSAKNLEASYAQLARDARTHALEQDRLAQGVT